VGEKEPPTLCKRGGGKLFTAMLWTSFWHRGGGAVLAEGGPIDFNNAGRQTAAQGSPFLKEGEGVNEGRV